MTNDFLDNNSFEISILNYLVLNLKSGGYYLPPSAVARSSVKLDLIQSLSMSKSCLSVSAQILIFFFRLEKYQNFELVNLLTDSQGLIFSMRIFKNADKNAKVSFFSLFWFL